MSLANWRLSICKVAYRSSHPAKNNEERSLLVHDCLDGLDISSPSDLQTMLPLETGFVSIYQAKV